ncbi:hypothetical protein MP638_006709 [Amoeboaphelidium occidentale]|nr:hypothetical protein MP638_006709 [Amoeboaphelidium occidentale]
MKSFALLIVLIGTLSASVTPPSGGSRDMKSPKAKTAPKNVASNSYGSIPAASLPVKTPTVPKEVQTPSCDETNVPLSGKNGKQPNNAKKADRINAKKEDGINQRKEDRLDRPQTYAASSNNSASSLQGSSFAAAIGIVGVLLM